MPELSALPASELLDQLLMRIERDYPAMSINLCNMASTLNDARSGYANDMSLETLERARRYISMLPTDTRHMQSYQRDVYPEDLAAQLFCQFVLILCWMACQATDGVPQLDANEFAGILKPAFRAAVLGLHDTNLEPGERSKLEYLLGLTTTDQLDIAFLGYDSVVVLHSLT